MRLDKTSAIMLFWLAIPLLLLLSDYGQRKLAQTATPTAVIPAEVTMVEIPAGEFTMGLTIEEAWQLNRRWKNLSVLALNDPFAREVPQLTVYLNTFFIDKFEVTNAQYRLCVEAGQCGPVDTPWNSLPPTYASDPMYDIYPVLGVSWQNADAYCRWADKRLPTEAEWEKAARGTDGRLYPWGNHWDRQAAASPQHGPAMIGSYPMDTSPYGVADMAGNAPEWTAEPFQLYPGNPRAHLYAPLVSAKPYVVRGFGFSELLSVVAVRIVVFTNEHIHPAGFRCVQGPPSRPLTRNIRSVQSVSEPQPAGPVDLSKMVYVPAGEFIMGTDDVEAYARRNDETPEHIVYLDAFYMDKFEVTIAEFVTFLNALGGHIWRCDGYNCIWERGDDGQFAQQGIILADGRYQVIPGTDNLPITYIHWSAANAYCRWAGKRLPTEAEWEKAARGTDGRKYPWGNEWDSERAASSHDLPPGAYPFPVGSHPGDVSPYGAFDMLGNADEWVSDWYAPNYYYRSPYENPRGPAERQFHVNRGISTQSAVQGITVRRGGRGPYIGFRCAYPPNE